MYVCKNTHSFVKYVYSRKGVHFVDNPFTVCNRHVVSMFWHILFFSLFLGGHRYCRRRYHYRTHTVFVVIVCTFQSQARDFYDKALIAFYHFRNFSSWIMWMCVCVCRLLFFLNIPWYQIKTQTINSKSKFIDFNHECETIFGLFDLLFV